MQILEQISLAIYTTMKVGGNARFFARVATLEELSDAVLFARSQDLPLFILGGGSNTVVSEAGFSGVVVKMEFTDILYEANHVTVGAGVVWDTFVHDAVDRGLWGIENLSLIPGSVGGAVVQNIGAYGVEAREIIFSVDAFDTETLQIRKMLGEECEFGYRESIFKKNKNLIVVRATFNLTKEQTPRLSYEDVKNYFSTKKVTAPKLNEIRQAIIAIRTAKLPSPTLGTAGSFFKNPIVDKEVYETLMMLFPEIKAYPQGDNTVKLSAAWLLDHVGKWKGVRRGDAGVHEKQALILVNYGTANAEEVLALANEMKQDIKEKTGVLLEEEVILL